MIPAHPEPEPAATHTFVWHDYETFGTDVRRDRPAQFAAIRTDAELREIGEPVMAYCQPSNDYLPDPDACLITGITPQECLAKGEAEVAFAARIERLTKERDAARLAVKASWMASARRPGTRVQGSPARRVPGRSTAR